jgi:hypothetical protein
MNTEITVAITINDDKKSIFLDWNSNPRSPNVSSTIRY